jgi:hypothetical protein
MIMRLLTCVAQFLATAPAIPFVLYAGSDTPTLAACLCSTAALNVRLAEYIRPL